MHQIGVKKRIIILSSSILCDLKRSLEQQKFRLTVDSLATYEVVLEVGMSCNCVPMKKPPTPTTDTSSKEGKVKKGGWLYFLEKLAVICVAFVLIFERNSWKKRFAVLDKEWLCLYKDIVCLYITFHKDTN